MPESRLDFIDQLFDEEFLLASLKHKSSVDKGMLLRYLRGSDGKVIPKEVLHYICLVLDGKVKLRRGRPRTSKAVKLWRIFRYSENRRWLERRADLYKRLPRFKSCRPPKSMDPRMPLNEVAARLISGQQKSVGIKTTLDPRTLRNMSAAFWSSGRLESPKAAASRTSPRSRKPR
jgi:hypothetical protein